jgi:hypothetical protein
MLIHYNSNGEKQETDRFALVYVPFKTFQEQYAIILTNSANYILKFKYVKYLYYLYIFGFGSIAHNVKKDNL